MSSPKERIRNAARKLAEMSVDPDIGEFRCTQREFYAATADEMDRQIKFDEARAVANSAFSSVLELIEVDE